MDPVLAQFRPLTASQRRIGKYFLVVAAVLLLQILVGSIMAHYYYGPDAASMASRSTASCRSTSCATCISRRRSSGSACRGSAPALFLAPAISGARSQGSGRSGRSAVLGDAVHRRRRAGRQLSRHHGLYRARAGSGSATRACPISSSAGSGRSGSSPGWSIWSVLVFRALWPTRDDAVAGDAAVLVRAHPARTSDLGLHHQHRRSLCLRHDPAHRASRNPSPSPISGAGGWSISGSSSPSSSSPPRSAPIS